MKVNFQRFGNLPRNLFISFKVFDQTQQFVSPLLNTSTCSDDSSKSEPRPTNQWRILFKYDHLFFLACYFLLMFREGQNIEGKTQQKFNSNSQKSISIKPLLLQKTKKLYQKKMISKAFTHYISVLCCGGKKKSITSHNIFSRDLTINWIWREICNLYSSFFLIFISKWYLCFIFGKLINALTKSVLYTSEK